ncbi:MAG TPA: PqqD family protein, partial [Thermodesulfobacteriota bacterium]|nr:PqqD family protein [Thermodesulfobacteriota bacterium]
NPIQGETFMNFTINKNIAHEIIDGEAIIVNLENGNYYSLDKTGADLWDFVEKGLDVPEIIEGLAQRYEGNKAEMENSVRQLLADMEKEGLITIDQEAKGEKKMGTFAPREGELKNGKKPLFESPTLQKYTDMQAMLWLDPIHEVDETGWPNTPKFSEEN